jgi:GcrA cell cycle regulator
MLARPPTASPQATHPAGRNGETWPDDHVAVLKQMHANGCSCRVIGEAIGRSRNSIIGKVHRLGLNYPNGGTSEERAVQRRVKQRVGAAKRVAAKAVKAAARLAKRAAALRGEVPARMPAPRVETITPLLVEMLELGANQCRWPYGDRPSLYCGLPAKHSYCPTHEAASSRMYVILTPEERELRRRKSHHMRAGLGAG